MYLKCIYYILYIDLSIREFMEAFTAAFPTVRRTVKMHLLEDHATELVEAKIGAEAIHARFNSLMMTDSCIHSVSSDDSIPWYGYRPVSKEPSW